jgi:predicted nucleic acid-binding protein
VAFSVVLDTCVLYPNYLRDTLLRLAVAGSYRPLWSRDILVELERNLPDRVTAEQAARVIAKMREHFEDAEVFGYEPLIDAMPNDPKDRHVLAAAVRANASAVVTFNLPHFTASDLAPFAVQAIHPDEFLLNQLGLAPGALVAVLERQARAYRRPPRDVAALLAVLGRSGVPEFAEEARRHLPPRRAP